MKRVALLSLPYLPDYMRNARCDFVSLSHTQWYPIWLGFLGSFLEKRDYQIKFIDAPAASLNFKDVEKILQNFKPEFLIVYTGRLSENTDIKLTEKLMKRFNCQSVLVGPYFSINPQKTLKKSNKIKYGIQGEFEYPVLELLQAKKPSTIKNLVYKKTDRGRISANPIRSYLTTKQLDEIPFISEFFSRHIDFKNYKTPSEFYPFIDIMTGRGCVWGKCTYCLWVQSFIKGCVYNLRSINNVIKEFKFIQEKLPQIKSVMIQDDTFAGGRAYQLSKAIIKHHIKLPWSCYARANLNLKTMKLMRKAGCLNLHVGYESGDNKVLSNVKKGLTREQMEKFTLDAHKAGLSIHADFAFGFPGETKESIENTIAWAKKLKPDTAQFQLMIPFKGTKFYKDLKKNGNLKNNEPNFKQLSANEIRQYAKKAYREFYFSWHYLKRILKNPIQHFVLRFDTYRKAIPAIFWQRWVK